MTRGYFVDPDGVPVYHGDRENKPGLEASHRFVPQSAAGERPSGQHAWNGSTWVASATLAERQRRLDVIDRLQQMDAALPRALEDLITTLNVRDGGLLVPDLPKETRDRLAEKIAKRAEL